MSIAVLYVAGLAYAALSIFGVGFALLAALRRLGLLRTEGAAAHILSAIALAILWATIFLTVVVAADVKLSRALVIAKLALDAALIVGGAAFAHRELRAIAAGCRDAGFLTLAAAGAVIGTWAFLQYPHVLDSTQIVWTQMALTNVQTPLPSSMPGFSAIVIFLGALFPDLPIATTSAAFKPLLSIIASCTAWHAVDCLGVRRRGLNALLFFVFMLLSSFGLYGMIALGKASIYGVLFSVAFMAALCRPAPARHAVEFALYFCAAAATGPIALPYMLVAYAIWLAIAPRDERAWKSVPVVYWVSLPILPAVLAGFFHKDLPLALAAAVVFGAAVFGLWRLAGARLAGVAVAAASRVRAVRAVLPGALALPSIFLLPVAVTFPVWFNRDASMVTARRPPLDGETTIVDYFLAGDPVQTPVMAFGVVAALALGFCRIGRERAGLVAAAAMPFVILLAGLLHVHLRLPLFTAFNLWDLIKDVTLWYGGPLFGLLAVALLNEIAERAASAPALAAAALVVPGAVVIGAAASQVRINEHVQPVTYTKTGDHADPDLAVAADIAWRELQGRDVLVDMALDFGKRHFYALRMFGAYPSVLDMGGLALEKFAAEDRVGFIVGSGKAEALRAFAAAKRVSLDHLADLGNGAGGIYVLTFDGEARLRTRVTRNQAAVVAGAHDEEKLGGRRFRWMRAEAEIAVTLAGTGHACITLRLFSAGPRQPRETVMIDVPGSEPVAVEIAATSLAAPKLVAVPVAAVNGRVRVRLRSAIPPARFPGDEREVVYGLVMPVSVNAGDTCPP